MSNAFSSVHVCERLLSLWKDWQSFLEVPADKSAGGFFICVIFRRVVKCVCSRLFLLQYASPNILHFEYKWYFGYMTESANSILQPKLVAVSNVISFANPKAPVYPRLALGKAWNEVSFLFRWWFFAYCSRCSLFLCLQVEFEMEIVWLSRIYCVKVLQFLCIMMWACK